MSYPPESCDLVSPCKRGDAIVIGFNSASNMGWPHPLSHRAEALRGDTTLCVESSVQHDATQHVLFVYGFDRIRGPVSGIGVECTTRTSDREHFVGHEGARSKGVIVIVEHGNLLGAVRDMDAMPTVVLEDLAVACRLLDEGDRRMKVIGRAVKRRFCLCELVRQVCIEPVVEGTKVLVLLHLQPENTAIAGAGWRYRPAYMGQRQVKSPDAVGKMVEEGLDRRQIRDAKWLLERDVGREDACVQAGAVGPVDGEHPFPDDIVQVVIAEKGEGYQHTASSFQHTPDS